MSAETAIGELVVTADPDTPVSEVARLMEQHQVGSVVVVEDEQPVGIVTDRDLALKLVGGDRDTETSTARDVMTPDPVTVEAGASTGTIIQTMVETGVRRMPIVEDGDLVDILTLDDMMRLLAGQQTQLAQVIGRESPELFDRFF